MIKLLKIDYVLPILLLLAFAVVLLGRMQLPSGFYEFRPSQSYKTYLAVFSVLPMLFLFCSKFFWQAPHHRKILLIGMGMLLLSTLYSKQYIFNNSIVFWGCSLVFFCFERKFYKPSLLCVLLIIYFFWHLLSGLWAIDMFGYKSLIVRYLLFLIFPLCFCLFRLNKREINWFLMLLFRAGLIFVFVSLIFWMLQCRTLGFAVNDWLMLGKTTFNLMAPFHIVYGWIGYNNPTFNALVLLSIMSFGLFLWRTKAAYKPNWLEIIIILPASLLLIIITQSRTGLILWCLIFVVFYLSFFWQNKKLFWLNISLLIALIIVSSLFFNEKLIYFFNDDVRKQIYSMAFYFLKDNYLLGSGLGGMQQIFALQILDNYYIYDLGVANPHNQFVGDLMQTGIVGLLLIISISVCLVYNSIKTKNMLLLIFFAIYFVVMQIEMPLQIDKAMMVFVVFVCFLSQNIEINCYIKKNYYLCKNIKKWID